MMVPGAVKRLIYFFLRSGKSMMILYLDFLLQLKMF